MSNRLKIFTSNRLEILADQLGAVVARPLSRPLKPEIIIVQSRGMQRWISLEMARRNQVFANAAFPFPNTFLNELFQKMFPDLPDVDVFDPAVMTFRILELLPGCIQRPEFESLKAYLSDDQKGLKQFQLAEKIADLFDQYLVFRPEMIFNWEAGKGRHWQAHLWRRLADGPEARHRARLRETLLKSIQGTAAAAADLPERLSIFGISYLPPFHMHVFMALSRRVPVNLFLMNPCREYWADILNEREIKVFQSPYVPDDERRQDLHLDMGNRLLASLGTLGRDFFSYISEIECDVVERFADPQRADMLSCVQFDILNLIDRPSEAGEISIPENDASIQVHSCHSPMREVEVLFDNLLALLEGDPALVPGDIMVMTPDIEAYAPYIQAVFDAQTDPSMRIPYSIADRSIKSESPLIEAFLSILDLRRSRLGAAQVMHILRNQAVSEKFDLSDDDIERLESWIRDTRIRWGFDARDREKLGLPLFSDNTWQTGMERMLLGYAMPENAGLFAGILPYDPIEGSDALILGRFLEFMDRIKGCLGQMETPRDLEQWRHVLIQLLDDFFQGGEVHDRELMRLRRMIDALPDLKDISGFHRPLAIDVVQCYLKHQLGRETHRFGFISGGVTFGAMLPMRSIPFKVICLIGMNTDAFPRENRSAGFDLMAKYPKRGDRSRRMDDKYLFLEALISARRVFYISYVGQSIQDNSPIPPAIPVSELIDYLKEGYGIEAERLPVHHPLQGFSAAYFQGRSGLFSYSETNRRAAARLLASRHHPEAQGPPFSGRLPMTSEEAEQWKKLNIGDLGTFFSNPARYLLRKRFDIYLDEKVPLLDERENFSLDPLDAYHLGQELVELGLSGADTEKLRITQRARGQFPAGTVGDVWQDRMRLDADAFIRQTALYTEGRTPAALEVGLNLAGFDIHGHIGPVYPHGLLHFVYANLKPKYLLTTWAYHILLNISVEEKHPRQSLLIGKDKAFRFTPVSHPEKILAALLGIYKDGLAAPLHFYPDSSYIYAQRLLAKKQDQKLALKSAADRWSGSDFARGEGDDPYYERCFGSLELEQIFDQAFARTSETVFKGLLEHLEAFAL